jgi:hypothetical protein
MTQISFASISASIQDKNSGDFLLFATVTLRDASNNKLIGGAWCHCYLRRTQTTLCLAYDNQWVQRCAVILFDYPSTTYDSTEWTISSIDGCGTTNEDC